MQMALYEPDAGYYSEDRRTGTDADFITSASVGKCFSDLQAEWIQKKWQDLDRPDAISVIEIGAHDGTTGLEILESLQTNHPECHRTVSLHLVEISSGLRKQAEKNARAAAQPIHVHRDLSGLDAEFGVLIGNELLDALPVRRIQFENGKWQEILVGWNGAGFQWNPGDLDSVCEREIDREIPQQTFADGFTTEIHPTTRQWIQEASDLFRIGFFLFLDYGHDREAYYHPARSNGTLRTYHQQHTGGDPLVAPGSQDITAHVNFSLVKDAARENGLVATVEEEQFRFLTRLATPCLMRLDGQAPDDPTRKWLRQFQQLTYSGNLGGSFRVVEFSKGDSD